MKGARKTRPKVELQPKYYAGCMRAKIQFLQVLNVLLHLKTATRNWPDNASCLFFSHSGMRRWPPSIFNWNWSWRKKNRTEKPCSCNNDYSPARVKRCWDTNKKLYISNALQEIKATQSVIVNAAPFEKGQNKLSAVQRIPFKNNRGKMATAICIMTGPNRIIIRDCLCMLHCCLMKMQPFICRLQD